MICETCASGKITYYRQLRRDGIWVVTARCENGHHPNKRKPFYPVSQFDIASLPVLKKDEPETQLYSPVESADPIERRRQTMAVLEKSFPRMKTK